MREFDAVFVGCGYHGIILLTTSNLLRTLDIVIVDASERIGGGSMMRYAMPSNSTGRKFLEPIKRQPAFAHLFDAGHMKRLAEADHPLPMNQIGRALEAVGDVLAAQIGNDAVLKGVTVDEIRVFRGRRTYFELALSNGDTLSTLSVVLATGRRDIRHPFLDAWSEKVVFVGDVISAPSWLRRSISDGSRRIVIVGASHSTFSALAMLRECVEERHSVNLASGGLDVVVVHRNEIALYYPSEEAAMRGIVPGRERRYDPERDVCPETGGVFRDTGLRGRDRDLYLRIQAGELPFMRLQRCASLEEIPDLFVGADLIIQALGSRPNVPRLMIDGEPVWGGDGRDDVSVDFDGRVSFAGRNGNLRLPFFAARIVPTPQGDKNWNPAAHNVYPRLATALLRDLDGRARHAVAERAPAS